MSQWLYAGLVEAGLPAILIETRHVKAALKAMTVKTDRNDARGMAQLMRMGWFRPVHVKAPMVQEIRALLTARKLLVAKLRDVESSLRGILRGFGLKVGAVSKGKFEAPHGTRCLRSLAAHHPPRRPRRARACHLPDGVASCRGSAGMIDWIKTVQGILAVIFATVVAW